MHRGPARSSPHRKLAATPRARGPTLPLPLPPVPTPSDGGSRWLWPLVAAYFACTLAGLVTGWDVFPLLALVVLASAAVFPGLLRGRLRAWLAWSAMQALLLSLAMLGLADFLLEAVPFFISAGLAWFFARTLADVRPLVARCIVAMEGEARLAEPGVARYAQQLTVFWALLLAANALLVAFLLVFADRGGALVRAGVAPPLRVDETWAAAWLHVGGYALLGATFVLEYAYRRWRLRDLHHQSLVQTLLGLARSWPRVVRGLPEPR